MRVTDTHIYFWSSIYSNWYSCNFVVDGILFNCSEQFYMYKKAMQFADEDTAKKILGASHPRDQKAFGRQVKNFDSTVWDSISYKVMLQAVYEKFNQNYELKCQLLGTDDKIFVEASPFDNIWGVGLNEIDDTILDEKNWLGKNWLGKVLCEVRERLKQDSGVTKKYNIL